VAAALALAGVHVEAAMPVLSSTGICGPYYYCVPSQTGMLLLPCRCTTHPRLMTPTHGSFLSCHMTSGEESFTGAQRVVGVQGMSDLAQSLHGLQDCFFQDRNQTQQLSGDSARLVCNTLPTEICFTTSQMLRAAKSATVSASVRMLYGTYTMRAEASG
jgi:hypothetical protein